MTGKTSILIVDDVPENLRLLSAMLEQTGHRVRPAISARLALMAARREPPSLILLDIRMPEMDGLEMCRQLKADETLREIPVIFISALNDTEDKIKAFEAGGLDYITKPFQEREVLARVGTHLKLHHHQNELADVNRQLRELESLRDSLTHMVVHDMNGLLTVILGHLGVLRMIDAGSLTEEGRRSLADAMDGAERLARMVSDILLASKLEAGKLAPRRVPEDLTALARRAAADFGPANNPRRIKINLTSSPECVSLPLDSELIGRVLQNLLGNAMKYAPAGSTIALAVTRDGAGARVEVADTGPGIAPEFHQKIFEKFGQVESRKSRRGTGLGLTFCKLAVEAHGGSIGVKSEAGQGSTFWFTLAPNPARDK
jgi:two-component system, sensor histidine kinase and response regulator